MTAAPSAGRANVSFASAVRRGSVVAMRALNAADRPPDYWAPLTTIRGRRAERERAVLVPDGRRALVARRGERVAGGESRGRVTNRRSS